MSRDELRRVETSWDESRQVETSRDDWRWVEMSGDEWRWVEMSGDEWRWVEMSGGELRWIRMNWEKEWDEMIWVWMSLDERWVETTHRDSDSCWSHPLRRQRRRWRRRANSTWRHTRTTRHDVVASTCHSDPKLMTQITGKTETPSIAAQRETRDIPAGFYDRLLGYRTAGDSLPKLLVSHFQAAQQPRYADVEARLKPGTRAVRRQPPAGERAV